MGMIGVPVRRYRVPEPLKEPAPKPLLLPEPRAVPVDPFPMPVRKREAVPV